MQAGFASWEALFGCHVLTCFNERLVCFKSVCPQSARVDLGLSWLHDFLGVPLCCNFIQVTSTIWILFCSSHSKWQVPFYSFNNQHYINCSATQTYCQLEINTKEEWSFLSNSKLVHCSNYVVLSRLMQQLLWFFHLDYKLWFFTFMLAESN